MRVCVLLLLASIGAPVLAHDLWIDRDGDLHTLHYGHERSGHAGTRVIEYRPEQVRQARCFSTAGRELASEPGRTWPVTLKGECAASYFVLSTGYWSKTPYGTKNQPRNEAGAVMDSWRSVESIKRIDAWGTALAKPLGLELEIVPLDNPLRLRQSDKLHLAVYAAGKPAAGATVAYFGRPRGVTAADGRVNVRLQQPGLQLIQASIETPLTDGKADRLVQATALQFESAP